MHVLSACHSCLDVILTELGENELNDVANVRIKYIVCITVSLIGMAWFRKILLNISAS